MLAAETTSIPNLFEELKVAPFILMTGWSCYIDCQSGWFLHVIAIRSQVNRMENLMSENYAEFKKVLARMQSASRMSTSVSASVSVARNLPETVEQDVPGIISRVLRFNHISLTSEEFDVVSSRVLQEMAPT
jgi:hypothetical protein